MQTEPNRAVSYHAVEKRQMLMYLVLAELICYAAAAELLLLLVIAVVVDYCCCCKQVQELATASAYGDTAL